MVYSFKDEFKDFIKINSLQFNCRHGRWRETKQKGILYCYCVVCILFFVVEGFRKFIMLLKVNSFT